MCGSKIIFWSVFVAAWKHIQSHMLSVTGVSLGWVSDGAATHFEQLDKIRQKLKRHGGEDLYRLLHATQHCEATDPRDAIYALLGMLSSEDRKSFNIDYRKPVAAVFTEAMSHILFRGQGVMLLFRAVLHCGNSVVKDLPSWDPDFSLYEYERTLRPHGVHFFPPFPNCAFGVATAPIPGRVLTNINVFKDEVIPVDIVDSTMAFSKSFERCMEQLPKVEALETRARTNRVSNSVLEPFYEKFRTRKPLWRVLVANTKHLSVQVAVPDYYGQMYKLLSKTQQELEKLDDTEKLHLKEFRDRLESFMLDTTFFTTRHGLIGIGVPGIRRGDKVTIWFNARVPFLIRHDEVGKYCRLVGVAYVGGIMDGTFADEVYTPGLVKTDTLWVR